MAWHEKAKVATLQEVTTRTLLLLLLLFILIL